MSKIRTITMTACDRPKYFRKALRCLSECIGIERYKLIIGVEPGCDESLELAMHADFADTTVLLNETRLGCPINTFKVLTHAFVESEFNIHIEDDILFAQDALMFFAHCDKTYREDASVLSVSGYNNQPCDKNRSRSLARRPTFTPWGWATWKDRFEEMAQTWDFNYSFGGWDETVKIKVRVERREVYPILARVQNIGAHGLHIPSPDWHKTFQFNPFWAGKITPQNGLAWKEETDWDWKPLQLTPEIREQFPAAWLRAAFKDEAIV